MEEEEEEVVDVFRWFDGYLSICIDTCTYYIIYIVKKVTTRYIKSRIKLPTYIYETRLPSVCKLYIL